MYTEHRRQLKKLSKAKKRKFNTTQLYKLESSVHNSKLFWRNVKQNAAVVKRRPNITPDQWFDHFTNVFNSNITNDDVNDNSDTDTTENYVSHEESSDTEEIIFNSCITDEEILGAVKSLNPNKSSSGCLIAEHFVYSISILLPYLRKLFNRLYQNNEFPSNWTTSVIVPLHKKVRLMSLTIIEVFP